MPDASPFALSPVAVRRAFARAAARFDEHAVLHREVADRLDERLAYMQLRPAVAIDLGAGTGYAGRLLERRYRRADILLVDIVPGMLGVAQRRRRWFARSRPVCADAARLPLADESVDLVLSNLAFPFCAPLDPVIAECRRVLRTGGLMLFSTFGPATLQELRAAWARVDADAHVNVFLDMHDVGDALIRGGFASPVMDRENIVLTYRTLEALVRDLRGTGMRNSLAARPRTLRGRRRLAALREAYESLRRDDVLPATFEIVFGHAWKPAPDARPQDGSTVATFPLRNLQRRQP